MTENTQTSESTEVRTAPTSDDLVSTIEARIVPRLFIAHDPEAVPDPSRTPRHPVCEREVEALVELAVAQDIPRMMDRLDLMACDGHSLESLLLDLIVPAAHRLGDLWLTDDLSFGQVTVASGALQRVAATIGQHEEKPLQHEGLVVLMAAPGEQHVLSLHVLAELLGDAGWATHIDPRLDEEELVELVSHEHVVMVGMTCKEPQHLLGVKELIAQVKEASVNPDLRFVLGGGDELAPIAPRVDALFCSSLRDMLAWLAQGVEN